MSPAPRGATELFELARSSRETPGRRAALARLISMIERGGAPAREVAELTYPLSGSAYTVGLTGAPGAGKSTLMSRVVTESLARDKEPVAVLAIDPSSPLSGGAILGDRVRMQDHGTNELVFIRSMATRGHLGGLASAVPEAVRLLDAAGWQLVFVETVGVGQVEVEVAGACDTVVLVLYPGWGDSVQANKAGLLEVADILVINKADRPGVGETRRDLVHMLQLSSEMDWTPPIVETKSLSGEGASELLDAIVEHRRHLEQAGRLEARRERRLAEELERLVVSGYAEIVSSLLPRERERAQQSEISERAGGIGEELLKRLAAREIDPWAAAVELTRAAADAVVSDPERSCAP